MKEIYIHIGSHKTATSSIQKSLFMNKDLLHKNNIHVPKNCTVNGNMHHPLVYDLIDRTGIKNNYFYGKLTKGKVWDTFHNEVKNKSKILISSEEFFLLYSVAGRKGLELLKEELKGYKINIICYLRRQDLFIESSYNQNIKFSSWSTSFERQISDLSTLKNNYFDILNIWGEVFNDGELIIRSFEKERFYNNSIIYDFFNIFNLGSTELLIPEMVNEKLPIELLELKRCINRVGYPFPRDRDLINENISRLHYSKYPINLYMMTKNTYETVVVNSKEVNKRISEKYLQGNSLFSSGFPSSEKIIFSDEYKFPFLALSKEVQRAVENQVIDKKLHECFLKASIYMLASNNILGSTPLLETLFRINK